MPVLFKIFAEIWNSNSKSKICFDFEIPDLIKSFLSLEHLKHINITPYYSENFSDNLMKIIAYNQKQVLTKRFYDLKNYLKEFD